MFRLDSVMQLKDEEQIRAMVRRHAVTLIGPLLLAMLLIVTPFFFLFPLFNLGVFGVIIFVLLFLVGAFMAFRTFFVWDNDVLIVTNFRVIDIDQRGLFSRHVSEAGLSAIQDVSWKKQGFWQTIFRMGSVTVQTAGATATIQGDDLPKPEKIQNLINDVRTEAPSPAAPAATPVEKDRRSRIRHIAAMLEEIKDEEVMEVENLLEKKNKEKSMQTLFNS